MAETIADDTGTPEESSQEFRVFWDNNPDAALWVRNGRIHNCNPAAERLFQRSAASLTGLSPGEVFPAPDDGVTTIHLADGSTALCSIWRTTVKEPAGELVVLRDITSVRHLEESLRERNAQLTSTIESIPFDFWMNDTENRTILQNPVSRALWGDQKGHVIQEVTDETEILEHWLDTNNRALQGETVVDEITYMIDNRPRTFRNVVAPVRSEDGIIGILGLNLEITDLKNALQDREKLLKDLHHLVRNDLQIILSTLNLHMAEKSLSPRQILQRVANQIETICLVHDQLYSGGPLSTVDLAEVALRLAPGSRITESTGPILCPIEQAIPVAILLAELVQWAAGDTPGGASIEIYRPEDGYVTVLVQANDLGKSQFRAKAPPEELAVVRGLVTQLSGSISVRDNPAAAVTVTIPDPF